MAESQGANSLRLRAAISLARSRQNAGRWEDGADALIQAANCVSSSIMSHDLREANDLIGAFAEQGAR